MVTHYFTLEALCGELRPSLAGAVIIELFTQQKNELVVRLERDGVESALIVSVDPAFNYFYHRDAFARAKKDSVDIFPKLVGASIEDINIVPGDRIIVIGTSVGLSLQLRLYNTVRSNIFLATGRGKPVESFKQGEEHIGKPSADPAAVFPATFQEFIGRLMEKPEAAVYAAAKRSFPLFGSTFAREALHRAGVLEDRVVTTVSDEHLAALYDAATAINEERKTPRPALYYRGDTPTVFSVVPLHHLSGARTETFEDTNRGVRLCVAQLYRAERIGGEKDGLMDQLKRIASSNRRSLDAARNQQKDAEKASIFERNGSLLMGHLTTLTKGMSEVTLPDILNGGGDVRITLDPKLPPVKNAERYFEKAKKAKLTAREIEERIAGLAVRDSQLSTMLLHLDRCNTLDQLKEFRTTYQKELRAMHIGDGKSAQEEQFPFRRFTVAGGFEVWVGKNSANNDLLTMKYAKPNDFWFHARGSSGSHTVLRVPDSTHQPSKEAIHAAASIAAYYSKMRNASSVPVAYCERKYVRKVKGLAEGAVYLDREKVVLVPPKLPPNAEAQ